MTTNDTSLVELLAKAGNVPESTVTLAIDRAVNTVSRHVRETLIDYLRGAEICCTLQVAEHIAQVSASVATHLKKGTPWAHLAEPPIRDPYREMWELLMHRLGNMDVEASVSVEQMLQEASRVRAVVAFQTWGETE